MAGKLVIIAAPSGAGKTTIVRHLLQSNLNLAFSVSATTRPLRGKEKDGVDYFFLTVTEFRKRIENNEFIEWEEVYRNILYGTLRSEVEKIWSGGKHALFDVDVKGGLKLKHLFMENSIAIFLMPPSVDELKNRLIARGTDTPEKIKMRVDKANEELSCAEKYDAVIINDNLEKAKQEAKRIVSGFINS